MQDDSVRRKKGGQCRAWTLNTNAASELPIRCASIGRWLESADEIDVLGLSKGGKKAIAGECKFKNSKVDRRVLAKLQGKCARLNPEITQCLLFSRAGFTEELTTQAESDQSARLIGLEELYT